MTHSRRLLIGIGVLAVGIVLVALLRPSPLRVELALVTRGPLSETVEEEGQTRVRDRYVVTAPVPGRVARITLREGDSVAPGRVVALVYPAPLDSRARDAATARVSQAEDAQRAAAATVPRARAAMEQAQRARARAQELGAKGLLAPEERERAELDASSRQRELESADFQAQAAAHDVEIARAALLGDGSRPVVLRSPVRGQVLRIPEVSERVAAAGTPLLEIGDASRLEVVADLISSDAVRVREGDPMRIEGWGGGALNGRVRRVEPSGFTKVSALGVEEQRVNVVGDFIDPPAGLGDRFRVELRIAVWENPSVLQVPGSAVFRVGDGWAVYVVAGDRARRRSVELGHRTPFEVEILRGIDEGMTVIRDPSDRVSDGARVRGVAPPAPSATGKP